MSTPGRHGAGNAASDDLLATIRRENLNVYRASPARLREDVGSEAVTQDARRHDEALGMTAAPPDIDEVCAIEEALIRESSFLRKLANATDVSFGGGRTDLRNCVYVSWRRKRR